MNPSSKFLISPVYIVCNSPLLKETHNKMLETKQYVRKPFHIDAVQVTADNMQEIAKWVDSEVRTDSDGKYVKVRVHRPANDKQTKAYVGDWVLYAGTGYKVYTPKAFAKDFEPVSDETKMIDTSVPRKVSKNADEDKDEVVGVVEGDVVVPKRVPKKRAS